LNDADRRVLHVLCSNNGMTGVETFVLQLCAAQRRLGLAPELALEPAGREELVAAAEAAGLPVHAFPPTGPCGRLPRKLATLRLRWRRIRALARVLRERRIAVLHLHAVAIAGLDAFLAAALARVPAVVVTHHATLRWFGPVRHPIARATLWLEKRLAQRVVMPYAAAAEELVAHGVAAARVRVVPFCIDEERFPIAAPRPARGTPFRLAILSRVVAGKGHGALLEAMARLDGRCPGLRLRVIGDGPLRAELEARAAALGVAERVEWTGWVAHAEVPALLADCDAVALPSHMPAETFPLSLLEAMALGLPAIGSRWYGIPDVIGDDGAGRVVEPEDPAGLAEAIAALADDPAAYARASATAVERVRTRFTGRAVAETYRTLYAEALAPKNSPALAGVAALAYFAGTSGLDGLLDQASDFFA
jgi:glycosyltransferase involved in cell wall biosynthesis